MLVLRFKNCSGCWRESCVCGLRCGRCGLCLLCTFSHALQQESSQRRIHRSVEAAPWLERSPPPARRRFVCAPLGNVINFPSIDTEAGGRDPLRCLWCSTPHACVSFPFAYNYVRIMLRRSMVWKAYGTRKGNLGGWLRGLDVRRADTQEFIAWGFGHKICSINIKDVMTAFFIKLKWKK